VTKAGAATRRGAWLAVLIAGYAIVAHYTNSNPQAKSLGAVMAIAPPLAVALGFAWRSRYRVLALAVATLAAALLAAYWRVVEANFARVYLFEDCGVYALLSFTFARTLLRGRVPLCTRWADLLHGPLPPVVVRYTRTTTAAWAVFFALISCVSLALYQFAPLRVWSVFSNFFTLPLVVLMFVGEYAVRRKRLPAAHRTGLLESVRVYLDSSRHPTTQRQ
jgi:uncharacterized membrane protein